MPETSSGLDVGAVQAMIAAAIPKPSTSTPSSEAIGGNVGSNPAKFSQEGHQHPRLTSTTYATIGADGTAAVTFSRSFANKPGLNVTETDATAGSQPLVARGLAWARDGNGNYTGVTIQASRAQMLPTINPLSGAITLLSGIISGVNTLAAQLTGYNIFGGSVVGATISVIAIARSDV